jgi:hypothetical protein
MTAKDKRAFLPFAAFSARNFVVVSVQPIL